MKVLEKGRPQTGWAKEFTCTGNGNSGGGGCRAKLLVEQGDLFVTQSHCRDETDSFLTFECSECRVWTDLTTAQAREAPQEAWNASVRMPGRGYMGPWD